MISAKDCQNIGEMLCDAAFTIFSDCGAESDFCVQHVVPDSVVFGGTNRVIFCPASGFRVDREACTSRFLDNWDMKYEAPRLAQWPLSQLRDMHDAETEGWRRSVLEQAIDNAAKQGNHTRSSQRPCAACGDLDGCHYARFAQT